ncbi:MAG: hypothetical protein AB1716_23005 [Planctomycetota bacterium]
MTKPCTPRRLGREWLVALCSYALVVAPFGCQIEGALIDGSGGGGDDTGPGLTSVGLFVNTDLTSPVIAGGRNAAGDTFFVYGGRSAEGRIARLDSILVRTAAGAESFIRFEAGRPVRLQGADGANLQITYQEVSATRLLAQATAFDASGAQVAAQTIDINLQRTAEQVAQMVQSVTGRTLVVPDEGDVDAAKLLNGKTDARQQGRFIALTVAVALVVLSRVLIGTSGQVLNTLFEGLAASVATLLLAIYSPVFLFAALLAEVVSNVFSTPLLRVFVYLPPRP